MVHNSIFILQDESAQVGLIILFNFAQIEKCENQEKMQNDEVNSDLFQPVHAFLFGLHFSVGKHCL